MSSDHPTRNAYLKDELRNILAALQVTTINSLSEATDPVSEAYIRGFTDAMRSVSIALGLLPITAAAGERVDRRRVWSASDSTRIEEESEQWDP